MLNRKKEVQSLKSEQVDVFASILSQYKDEMHYPELTRTGNQFADIRIYREWGFGRNTAPRLYQKADLPSGHLKPDASNLGLVLKRLGRELKRKNSLLEALRVLYDGIEDFDVDILGGSVQVFLHEKSGRIPATRLSDGTLRYLCLLAILCDPDPGPLVCIEEPELGLHPDVLPSLAELIKEASERTQIVITTHSDILVDAFHNTPESVLVTERAKDGTHIKRLDAEDLKSWLEKYRLGELWTSGEIGGNRW